MDYSDSSLGLGVSLEALCKFTTLHVKRDTFCHCTCVNKVHKSNVVRQKENRNTKTLSDASVMVQASQDLKLRVLTGNEEIPV